jgi:RNA polymerase sigma factor (TIGR02999 family)
VGFGYTPKPRVGLFAGRENQVFVRAPHIEPAQNAPSAPFLIAPGLAPVYDELRSVAAAYFRRVSAAGPIDPTELVHEAYIRLAAKAPGTWQDERHFVATAATVMRRILVDRVRKAQADGRARRHAAFLHLSGEGERGSAMVLDLLTLDDALTSLCAVDPDAAHVAELRFFGGLSLAAVSDVTCRARSTVSEQWAFARAWLARRVAGGPVA